MVTIIACARNTRLVLFYACSAFVGLLQISYLFTYEFRKIDVKNLAGPKNAGR